MNSSINNLLMQLDKIPGGESRSPRNAISYLLCAGVLVILFLGTVCSLAQDNPAGSVVKVEKTDRGWRLVRNGQPYYIKGAGGDSHFDVLAACGGNSTRTWGMGQDTASILDDAQKNGLTVTVGFWMGHKEHGFKYEDDAAVKKQLEEARAGVVKYRQHPAVLMWGVGNEAEGDGKDTNFWNAVEGIAAMMHKEDPNHPTIIVLAEIGEDKLKKIDQLCPDIDVVGINSYAGMASLPERMRKQGISKPFVITEFGPRGDWEVAKTAWDSPIEASSAEKAAMYLNNFKSVIQANPDQCLGSYAFYWAGRKKPDDTWYGMLLYTGERLAAAETMSFLWTGKWPANRCPVIGSVATTPKADKPVAPETVLEASAKATDPDGDKLEYRWTLVGEPMRKSPVVTGNPIEGDGPAVKVRMPAEAGAYRLYLYVLDGKGNAAMASIPLCVKAN